MGNASSILDDMNKVIEYTGRADQENELFKALEVLSAKIKSNPAKTISVINSDNTAKNWNTFATVISTRSEANEKNSILVMDLIEVMLSNPDNQGEVAAKIIGDVSFRDSSKSTLLSVLIEQLSHEKMAVRFAALKIIDRLAHDPRFIEKQIEGSVFEPYLRLLDTEIRMYQDDVLNVVFPAKNICLKILQEIIEGEESDDLKEKCKKGRAIDICCKVIYQAREQKQKIQPITEIAALKFLATLCTYRPCREDIEYSGEFDEVALLFPELTHNESKIHLVRFLVYMSENASILNKIREAEKIIEFMMAELSRVHEPTYRAFLCVLAIALSPDAANSEILKELGILSVMKAFKTIQCNDAGLLKHLISLFTKISAQATKPKECHEFFKYLIDPIASILKLSNFKEIVGYGDVLDALEHLSLTTVSFDFWANRASIDIILEKGNEIFKKKNYQPQDVVLLRKIITIIANMYLSRGSKTPPCEDKVIELMLRGQNFQFQEIEGADEIAVKMGRFTYFPTEEATEIRKDAKLVLASVANMQIQSKDAHALYKMIFKMMSSNECHATIQFRALCCLAHLALDQHRRFILLQSNIIRKLIEMLNLDRDDETYPFIVREAAKILTNIFKSPDGMILWLKFNSSKISLDSSLNYNLLTIGKPEKLKETADTIFGKWGAKIGQGEVLEIPGQGIFVEEYTFCCWICLPYTSSEFYFHTLVQEAEGAGGLLVIDQHCNTIGTFDEQSGQLVESPINLQKLAGQPRKWHHIAVTVESNTDQSGEKKTHKITYFFDGQQQGDAIPINAPTNIKYLGNSRDRKESAGRIADLRIYPYLLRDNNISEIYNILQTYEEDDNFDNIGGAFSKCGIDAIPLILNSLDCNVPDMQVELCKLIAAMCTTRVSRMEFVRRQAFDVLLAKATSLDENVRLEVSRAMMYLM